IEDNMISTELKREQFHKLHESGCFLLPNPWDVGSAALLAHLGFKAIATTSSGFAWSTALPDNKVKLDMVLNHLRTICSTVDIPVNADFESGFAVDADGVQTNVLAAIETGIAGISIEDSTGDAASPLFEFHVSVERVRAARKAIDESASGVVLTGRSEGFI